MIACVRVMLGRFFVALSHRFSPFTEPFMGSWLPYSQYQNWFRQDAIAWRFNDDLGRGTYSMCFRY